MPRKYEWIDRPSIDEYCAGLDEISARISGLQRLLLTTQYHAPDQQSTAPQLAHWAGVKGGYPVVNSLYGRLGRQFSEQTGFYPDKRRAGTYRWWTVWSSGYARPNGFLWELLPEVSRALEELKWVEKPNRRLPEEVNGKSTGYIEGATCTVTVNSYERNSAAREECIKQYGTTCVVCGFNFEHAYGTLAAGYIHIHHLRPLAEIGKEYVVDPMADLRPVCPNCHAVIHLNGVTRSIEEVKGILAHKHKVVQTKT